MAAISSQQSVVKRLFLGSFPPDGEKNTIKSGILISGIVSKYVSNSW